MGREFKSRQNEGFIDFRGHIAELDVLRAIGILLVLTNHFWPMQRWKLVGQVGQTGWIAMDSFFVLSGLLITGILLDARNRPTYFRDYYLRRSLRIFPLYYCVLIALILYLHHAWGGKEYSYLTREWGSPFWYAIYLGNFRDAFAGKVAPVGAFGPLWSLQVEEQFYLLFPVLVRYLPARRLSFVLWPMLLISPLLRLAFYAWRPQNVCLQYELLPCHMEGLVLGALMAIRLRRGPWKVNKPLLTVTAATLLLAACMGSILSKPTIGYWAWTSPFNRLIGYSISSWGTAALILWLLAFRGSIYTRWTKVRPLQYLGKISYGMYLLHPVVLLVIMSLELKLVHLRGDGLPRFFVLVLSTILAATFSWYFFEKPILGLKDRWAPRREETVVKAPPASEDLTLANENEQWIPQTART